MKLDDVTEYNITVGHRPFSDQVMLLTDRFSQWSAIFNCFCSCNSLLLVFITCVITVIIIVVYTFHYQCYSIAIEVFTPLKHQLNAYV